MSEIETLFQGRVAISIDETAAACDLCANSVRPEIERGGFDVVYFGRVPRVTVASILRRLKAQPLRHIPHKPRKQPTLIPEPIPQPIPRKRGRPIGSKNIAKEIQAAE